MSAPAADGVEVVDAVDVEAVADPESVDELAAVDVFGSELVSELPPDEFDEAGAATATPQPMRAAAPTPSATASPPIRPIYLEAPTTTSRADGHPPTGG